MNALGIAVAAYSALIRAFPRRFRERFGRDLREAFRDSARAALDGWQE